MHAKRVLRWLAAFLVLLAWGGCGRGTQEIFTDMGRAIEWPEPPEQARIRYIGQLTGQEDLKREVSGTEAFGRIIFGRKNVGVLRNPKGVAVDDQERLFVADGGAAAVHMMDLRTRKYMQFSKIDGRNTLLSPIDVTVAGENVYVSDGALGRVCVFDKAGNYRFAFGQEIMERPSGLAYCAVEQRLYVADTKRHAIEVFDRRGVHLGTIGGSSPKGLRFPTFVAVDLQGRVYVSDTLNYCVQVFGPDGSFIRFIGEHGNRPGHFAHPCGIAVDGFGNIYVTDKQFENFQIFNSEGQVLMAVGREGRGPGEFWLPMGACIDRNNRIFVADSFNRRIQIFQLLEDRVR